jgi:hypothetical protein
MTDATANRNFLKPNRSTFVLMRTPQLTYYCQNSSLPSIDLGNVSQTNPFISISYPGDKITFNELTIDFLVDEDMTNYMEIYNWMLAIGYPDNFDQYARGLRTVQATGAPLPTETPFSDGTLVVNTSANNMNLAFRFVDLYPSNLGVVNFTTKSADAVSAQATFKYRKWEKVGDIV